MHKALLTVLAALALAFPASATTVFPKTYTCPIGGEVFETIVLGSYSVWGHRPDGRPFGTLRWAPPTPECPGNGFLIFRDDLTPEEDITLLTPLVESAEYQALRQSETQHYRLWWLMRALPGSDPARFASALLTASWHSDNDPARKTRYQRDFIAAAQAVPAESEDWFIYNLRVADAWREQGEFDAAEARIAALNAAPDAWPAEPANLVPPRQAVERCIGDSADLSAAERDVCAKPDYVEAIAEHRAWKQANR